MIAIYLLLGGVGGAYLQLAEPTGVPSLTRQLQKSNAHSNGPNASIQTPAIDANQGKASDIRTWHTRNA